MNSRSQLAIIVCAWATCLTAPKLTVAQDEGFLPIFRPEQQQVLYHGPGTLPQASSYGADYTFDWQPPRLNEPRDYRASRPIGLDTAIRIAIENVDVVRALAGNGAVASGRTIYDAAIVNTTVDQARSAFDPTLSVNNNWIQDESPGGTATADGFVTRGNVTENYSLNAAVTKRNMLGGQSSLSFNEFNSLTTPAFSPLNPTDRFYGEVSYTQPLLRGAGVTANRVPIVIARLNTERSFFQFRGSMQDLIRGVVEAYWNVVATRTELWAREKQIEQATLALERAEARQKIGLSDVTETAQARSALANFKAQKIATEGALLNREAALQNILGIEANSIDRLVPTSPPIAEQIALDWSHVFELAEERRPDIIEAKLIYEADRQQLLQAKNLARPTLNAVGRYRWDGLVGQLPTGDRFSTESGEFADWQLGINFSVPLFMREERASLRSAELVLARDQANIRQLIHSTGHSLAVTLRQVDQAYAQYNAYREVREAARINLERQLAASQAGTDVIFLNVLQAISDWGNAVSQEAQALLQYNITLASLERETGTILETHGVWFVEDQQCNVGPMWLRHERNRLYPHAHRPTLNDPRYETSEEPAEEFFDLNDYPGHEREPESTDPAEDPNEASLNSEYLPDLPPALDSETLFEVRNVIDTLH